MTDGSDADASAGRATFEGRAMTVTVLGDSNSVMFDGMLVRSPRRPKATFAFRTLFFPELRAADLIGGDGNVNALVREGLVRALQVDAQTPLQPVFRSSRWQESFDRQSVVATLDQTPADRPLLAFSVGHQDYAEILFRLGPGVDFRLPDVRHGPAPLEPVGSTTPVPSAMIDELAEPVLRGFERTVALLTAAGFDRVYVIGFRPPPLDDDAYEERWKIRSRAHLRYKVTLLLNDRLAKICATHDVDFVDPWPLLTAGGLFDERFELDLLHLNSYGTERIATEIVDRYLDRFNEDRSTAR